METPEAADALTVKEIAQVNEAFAPFKERENVSYVNSVCAFFTSYYERPEDLDLVEFLRYMGIGGTVEDEAEFQALKGAGGWPFQGGGLPGPDAGAHPPVPADGAGRVPGGARRHHHGRPDECAGELRGAGVLAGDRRLLQLHQRRRPRHVHLRGRPVGGKPLVLTGGGKELTLEAAEDGRYLFRSFLPLGRGGDMTEKGQQRTRGVHRGSFPCFDFSQC